MMRTAAGALLFLALVVPADAGDKAIPVTIPVAALAGKSPQQVTELLAAPTGCENNRYGRQCSYRDATVSIVFINDRADWFVVHPAATRFAPDALKVLGLPQTTAPVSRSGQGMQWRNIDGLMSVTAVPTADTKEVAYFYVQAYTP